MLNNNSSESIFFQTKRYLLVNGTLKFQTFYAHKARHFLSKRCEDIANASREKNLISF